MFIQIITMKQNKPKQGSLPSPVALPQLVEVNCEITTEDYDRMHYYYDSGMVDITTMNAAALALKKHITAGHRVQVMRESRGGAFVCVVDGEKYVPSCDLAEVIDKAEHGLYMEQFRFDVCLPSDLVENPGENVIEKPVRFRPDWSKRISA